MNNIIATVTMYMLLSAQPVWAQTAIRGSLNDSAPSTISLRESTGNLENGQFVTVRNGHLSKDGKRLRQWGFNLQSGMFKTYGEIDSLVERLSKLGFNAVRIWPTADTFYTVNPEKGATFNTSAKGDGSALDRFDYMVARFAAAGMTTQMTMLHYFGLPALRGMREPQIAEWVTSTRSDLELRRVASFAPYVSEGYRARFKQHMRDTLTRINPYTGRNYLNEPSISAWELANEASFVPCAMGAWCLDGLPSIARETLEAKWKASTLNPARAPLPDGLGGAGKSTLKSAYRQFVADQFIAASEDLKVFLREIGGFTSGTAVQPVIFNTGIGDDMAIAHYAHGAGDVLSLGAYHSPLSKNNGVMNTPWRPIVMGGPRQNLLENVRIKDKPVVVYETSFFRPYAFRGEWGPVMAAIALQQDWDGIFLYQYGQPWLIYFKDGQPDGYGTRALAEPVPGGNGEQGTYYYGFHHGSDPVVMASWAVGAALFLGAPEVSGFPLDTWDIALTDVFADKFGYSSAFISATGKANMPRDRTIAVRFVSGPETKCTPCFEGKDVTKQQVKINWQTENSRLTVATPGGTAIVGMLDGDLGQFTPNISARVLKPGFGLVAAVQNGLQMTKLARLFVVGDAKNTGWQFDLQSVAYAGPAGAYKGVTAAGTAPLTYTSPTVQWETNFGTAITTRDFGLNQSAPQRIGKTFTMQTSTMNFTNDIVDK